MPDVLALIEAACEHGHPDGSTLREVLRDPANLRGILDATGAEVLPMQCPECGHKPGKKPRFSCSNCGAVKVHDEFEILLVRPRGEATEPDQADDPHYRPAPQMGHVERPRGEATDA